MNFLDVFGGIGASPFLDVGLGDRQQFEVAQPTGQPFFERGIGAIREGQAEQRRLLTPFIQAGAGQIGALEEGATPEGFGERLRRIFEGGALDPLIEERTRAAQGQFGAAGLTRSGGAVQEIAAIPQDIGLMIENLLSQRSGELFNVGQETALGFGGLVGQGAGQQAGVFAGEQQRLTQEGIAEVQAESAQERSRQEAKTQRRGQSLSFVSSLFSDPSLKENVEKIGNVNDLNIYQWDWIPGAMKTIIGSLPTIGFMATEVKEGYPEFVKTVCGFLTVDYDGLLNRLETDGPREEY